MRVVLSPYAHELHYTGDRCADDCPACRWVEERERARTRKKRKPPQAERLVGVTSVTPEVAARAV